MLLWLGFSLLTAIVVAAVLRPLIGDRGAALNAAAADMAVYRDQIAEIAADRERGLIGDAEADAARAEVARRLLARERAAAAEATTTQGTRLPSPRLIAAVIAVLLPLGAIALYLKLGSPSLPSQPHSARLKAPTESASLDELVGKVEARLRLKPDDGLGWDVIAPVYMVRERPADAANAYARAIALLGETPKRLSGLAEAHVMASNGMVNETARLAYERLRTLEPGRLEPRFWLALAKEQDGNRDAAAADYRALIADAPPDAAWKPMVAERLAALTGNNGLAMNGAAPVPSQQRADPMAGPGPSAQDIDAAGKLSPAERTAMIERMVEGLAGRLKENGKDLAGWLKLVRAYAVMGRRGDAVAAVAAARGSLAGDSAALAEIDALAKALDLGS
jgi:cytochrome c-type biogenesis protein CcmH